MQAKCCLVFLLFTSGSFGLHAQSILSPAFQQKAALAFNPSGRLPASIQLVGSATWTAGSQRDSGTLQLEVAADGSASESWSFSTVSHSLTQTALGTSRTCTLVSSEGKQKEIVGPNCLQGVPWFAPGFVFLPAYSLLTTVVDTTSAADTSKGVEKLAYAPSLPKLAGAKQPFLDTIARLEKATAVSIEYDSQTGLARQLAYKQASDNDERRGFDVTVVFSDYSAESGVMIPHHIQRYVQRTLQLDLNVTSITVR